MLLNCILIELILMYVINATLLSIEIEKKKKNFFRQVKIDEQERMIRTLEHSLRSAGLENERRLFIFL